MTDGSPPTPIDELTVPDQDWELVVPDGWAVAPVAHERLTEAAEVVGADVVALGAPMSEPQAGVSGRVHAERCSMAVTADRAGGGERLGEPVGSDPYRGAVLVRSGVEVVTSREGVHVAGSPGVVPVPGAVSHDPWVPVAELADAVPEGRPPFPSRPVVLAIGLEDDLDQSDAARGIVNALLRNGVEGRLAVPEVTEGLLSAQPCAPTEATVRALRPEVVIVLDDTARVAVEGWLGRMDRVRGTVLVELTNDIAMDIELVSWRLGETQGRLRARIGPRVGSKRLAALVNRLVSGPQPEPPTDVEATSGAASAAAEAAVTLVASRVRRRKRGRAVVLHPVTGASRRCSGFVEHLAAYGWTVDSGALDRSPMLVERARTADLVIGDPQSMGALLDRVTPAGGTVVDIEPEHLLDEGADEEVERLSPVAEKATRRAGAAVSASQRVLEAVRSLGVRRLHLPNLYPQEHLEGFATARRETVRDSEPVIGWTFDGERTDPAVTSALVRAVDGLVNQGVLVEVVADTAGRVPDGLVMREGLTVRSAHPEPDELAAWWGQIWAPGPGAVARTGDPAVVVEAAAAGVPTVAPMRSLGSAAALLDPANLVYEVTSAGSWHEAVSPLLAGTRNQIRTGVHERVVSLHGRQAAGLAIGRLDGWLRRGTHQEDQR